jgi:hypothetical protein
VGVALVEPVGVAVADVAAVEVGDALLPSSPPPQAATKKRIAIRPPPRRAITFLIHAHLSKVR